MTSWEGKQDKKRDVTALPGHSSQLTMDAIFARLDLAYGYHASTCQYINQTLSFFKRAAPWQPPANAMLKG